MTAELEIEVSMGATKGLANYSSERADQRIRLKVEVEGDSLPDWLNDAVAVEDQLRNHLVYGIADALGLDAELTEGGKAKLIWPEAPPPVAPVAPQPQPQPQAQPQPQGGGGDGGQRQPPKVDRATYAALPRYAMDFGEGMKMYVDQRSLKIQGLYSAKAPDWKEDVPNGKGFWIVNQDGTINFAVQQAMAASNVT